jgi:ATP-dependent DNA ligase
VWKAAWKGADVTVRPNPQAKRHTQEDWNIKDIVDRPCSARVAPGPTLKAFLRGFMDLVSVIEKLNSTNSTKDKEEILLTHKNNEDLKKLLYLNLNPYKLFYMNKIPAYINNKSGIVDFKKFSQICEKLEKREVVGNESQALVKSFLEETEEQHAKLFAKVISKSAIGVGAKTVNKVWPNFIPEFSLMLAPSELPEISSVNLPVYIQPKLDGFRCVYKDGLLWSRTGKPFGNKNLIKHFEDLQRVKNYVLDGELYIHGIPFQQLTSILNTEEAKLPSEVKYFVYDCIPNKDWEQQKTKLIYEKRLSLIRETLNDKVANYKKVIDVSTDLCSNAGDVINFYKEHLKQGYEGSMLKDPNGFYRWKRVTVKSGEMLKLKPFKSVDLEVVDIYAGEGKFEGIAGGIICKYNNSTVSVGSGFDILTRKALAQTPNNFIGKTVEIKYFEKTEDGNSLRFPIFERWREDK